MDRGIAGEPALRTRYALAALAILAIEVAIALFVRDRFVRPLVGDALAVALVYAGLRAVAPLRVMPALALALALAIAFAVEFGQWFGVLDALRLAGNGLARVVMGTQFALADFAAYAAGALAVLGVERLRGDPD